MKLAITIEHSDPGYVEQRGGYALLSHLRGAPERVEHRRQAVARAFNAFEAAEREQRDEAEIGGLGLLVLQRAFMASEDLGGLLHAFAGADPWERLRTAGVPELRAAYRRVSEDLEGVLTDAFRLPDEQHLSAMANNAGDRRALGELRRLAIRRWGAMLERSAWLWSDHVNVAKATMHAFPVVAGRFIHGPPRAGIIADGIGRIDRRFVVLLTSTVFGTDVTTDRTLVRLDRDRVAAFRRFGVGAARLVEELCEAQATSIMAKRKVTIPVRGLQLLDEQSRVIIERLASREAV